MSKSKSLSIQVRASLNNKIIHSMMIDDSCNEQNISELAGYLYKQVEGYLVKQHSLIQQGKLDYCFREVSFKENEKFIVSKEGIKTIALTQECDNLTSAIESLIAQFLGKENSNV